MARVLVSNPEFRYEIVRYGLVFMQKKTNKKKVTNNTFQSVPVFLNNHCDFRYMMCKIIPLVINFRR